jgi:hypothetical protein
MPGGAIAGVVGSVASGIIGSRSANKAADAQTAAANAQIAEARRQFDIVQSLLKPYVTAGTKGLGGMLSLMGIGGQAANNLTVQTVPGARRGQAPTFKVGDKTFATKQEADAYAKANSTGAITDQQAQQAEIDKITGGAQFGELTRQGEYAIQANASATGGLRGGNTQAALGQYRPALLQSLIDRQLQQYGGLAQSGQNAAANTGTAAQNAGAQVNQALGDRGAAQAGAALAGGAAWQNAGAGLLQTFGNYGQRFGESPIFNGLFGGGKGLGNLF